MEKLICNECGTSFNCGGQSNASRKKSSCWCMNLPNLRGSFDLAGDCVCPDCMTLGKAKAITKMRKQKKAVRKDNAIR